MNKHTHTDMITFTSLANTNTVMPSTMPASSELTFEDYATYCMRQVVETPVCPPSGFGSEHETVRVSA